MKKRVLFLLCLLMALSVLLTACGGNGGETSTPDASSDIGESNVDSNVSGGDEIPDSSDGYIDESDSSDGSQADSPIKPQGSTTANKQPDVQNTTKGNGTTKKPDNSGPYDPYAGVTADMRGKTVRILVVNGPDADDTASGEAFKKKTGIRYRFLGVPLTMYKTKLTTMVATNDAPDLAFMTVAGTGDYPSMILKGQIQPLPEGIFDVERDTKLDKFMMDATSWGGKYYGIMLKNSIEYQRGVVVYNKALFQERGVTTPYELWKKGQWNRETFAETAKKMTYKVGNEQYYGFGASDGLQAMLSAAKTDFVLKKDGDKFVNNLSDNKLLSVLQWASDLREKGYWYADNMGAQPLFKGGKMAMYSDMSWILRNHTGIWESVPNAEVVPIPSDKGGDAHVQAVDACVVGIPTGAKNVKEACYFARYWLDADNVNLEGTYPNKQFVEMMDYMSNAKNRFSQVSCGVCGYDDDSQFSSLQYAFHNTANDIPVFLKSKSSVVDGLVSRINGQKAPKG